MLEARDNNKNDATTVNKLDDGCRIQLCETEELMGSEAKRKSQLRIEFNDLNYSVYRNGKDAFILHCPLFLHFSEKVPASLDRVLTDLLVQFF